ncbi:transport-related membrane protein [Pigmentiphaga litoralis]|uniref:Wzz/FepE/Etk N-terminal domain-containing protein n=1 Tax=Pigmentiphaga litoralis TaxID=516702 RepID=UPI0019B050EE|nr:Wzz/FepE/Etk N-terminal domain-containing protein [Pigmentiphaga litoralis]GGX16466.1 transport-related membrane protein [Pigmentiphaga litoralis]
MTQTHVKNMPDQGSGLYALDDDELSLIDVIQVIAENLRLLVLGPLVVGLIALGISFTLTPTFTATSRFLPPQQQQSAAFGMLQSLGGLGGLAGAAAGIKNPSDQYVAFLKTNTVQDSVIDRFSLQERYEQEYRQSARKQLEGSTRITAGKDGLISIDFDDADPQFAARVANAYVDELGALLNRLAITEAQQRRVFFEKQLASTKDNLIRAEQALAASGVSPSALNANPSTALEGPARLRAQVTAQEVKLAAMRSYLTESAPEYRQAQAELSALRGQLAKAEKAQPATSASGNDYIAKYREFKYQETLFDLFARQFETAKIDESREGASIQVVDEATPPELKSKPKRATIAVATSLATGFFLLIFVFMRQIFWAGKDDPATAAKLGRLRLTFAKALGRV